MKKKKFFFKNRMDPEKFHFYYFVYGNNLQSDRIFQMIPNAKFVCIGLCKV
jgi:hypothetical protein